MAASMAVPVDKPTQPKRLTILCLHGFRQNSSQFKVSNIM